MVASGGLNVYPKEVEDVIYQLDVVADASVVGVPDDRWGEIPVAIVVPVEANATPETVLDACESRLARYKRPRHVLFRTEDLPRTPSGKVLKRQLRPWAVEQLRGPAPPPAAGEQAGGRAASAGGQG